MPDQPFTVHVDLDALARQELSDAAPAPSPPDGAQQNRSTKRRHDDRLDTRGRGGRSSGAGKGRSYAFRRS